MDSFGCSLVSLVMGFKVFWCVIPFVKILGPLSLFKAVFLLSRADILVAQIHPPVN